MSKIINEQIDVLCRIPLTQENIKKNVFWRFLYAPIIPFKALVYKTYDSIYENAIIEAENPNKIYFSNDKKSFEVDTDEEGNMFFNVDDKKVLKFDGMQDGNIILKVSLKDYVVETKDSITSNYYEAVDIGINKKRNDLFNLTIFDIGRDENDYLLKIILSFNEFSSYLMALDDIIYMNYAVKISKLGLIKRKEENKEYKFLKDKNNSYSGIITYGIARHLMRLYIFYDNEILKSNIYGIEDVLGRLDDVEKDISKERYENLIKEISDFLNKLVETAETIPIAKLDPVKVTALDNLKKKAEQDNVNNNHGNLHKENLGTWEPDEADKLLEHLRIRNDLLNIYNR